MEEEPDVPAPRSREALTLVLGGLAVGGGSRPNVVDEAEGRPGDSMERRCVVGARLAVSAREGVLSVETHRRAATGNTKSREVAGALAGTASLSTARNSVMRPEIPENVGRAT